MSEQEEFEFRYRLEQEQAAQKPAEQPPAQEQQRPGVLDIAKGAAMRGLSMGSPLVAAGEFVRGVSTNYPEQVVRYGVPVAAQLATARFTGGSLPATMAVGAVSGYGADLAAQEIEKMQGTRTETSQAEAVAQGVMGATPFKGTGSMISRMAPNILAAPAFSEAARYIQDREGYTNPFTQGVSEAFGRLAVPAAASGLISAVGATGKMVAGKGAQANAMREGSQQAQQEFGVTMGREPLLQDLFGGDKVSGTGFIRSVIEPAAIERAAISRANPRAMDAMEKALVGPSEGFAALRQNAPDLFPLTEDVRKNIGVLEPIYQQAKKSRELAQQLTQQAQDLQIQGQAAAPGALEAVRAAKLKAFADEATYSQSWQKLMGKNAPDLKDIALGERNAAIAQAGEVARDARDLVVSEAYKKAGIDENDAIVSVGDILNKAQEKITANASRADFVAAVKSAFGEDPATIIDRTSFIEARDKLAAAITQRNPGIDPSAATRKASQYYQTMKEASLDFIGREAPDKLAPYQAAQARAAKFFDAADSKAYQLLAKGDAEGFYKAAKATGASANSVYDQAMKFTKALREEGAGAVADGLEKSINTAIRDGILDNVANKGTGFVGSRIYDPHALVRELQGLQDAGFPVGKIGLGNVKDIQALARISATYGGNGFTTSELNNYLNNVEKLGLDRAAARLRYEKAVQTSFLETDPAKRLQNAQRIRGEARRAGLDASQQEAIAKQLESDPLIKFLNEPGSETAMGIVKDPAKNTGLAETILTLEPTMVRRFMGSLRASNRGQQADALQKSVIASVFGKFGKGTNEIDLAGVLNTFRNPENQGAVDSLRAVLGDQGYQSLVRNVVNPLDDLAKSYERAGQPLPNSFHQLRTAITAAKAAKEMSLRQSGTYFLTNSLRGAIEALQNGEYNLMHTLFINQNTAPQFARAGYDLNRFMQQPANAAAVKLANALDAQSMAASQGEQSQ